MFNFFDKKLSIVTDETTERPEQASVNSPTKQTQVMVECSAVHVADAFSLFALSLNNDYLVFRWEAPGGQLPVTRFLRWHRVPGKRVVSMDFDSSGRWLLICAADSTLVLLPLYYLMRRAGYHNAPYPTDEMISDQSLDPSVDLAQQKRQQQQQFPLTSAPVVKPSFFGSLFAKARPASVADAAPALDATGKARVTSPFDCVHDASVIDAAVRDKEAAAAEAERLDYIASLSAAAAKTSVATSRNIGATASLDRTTAAAATEAALQDDLESGSRGVGRLVGRKPNQGSAAATSSASSTTTASLQASAPPQLAKSSGLKRRRATGAVWWRTRSTGADIAVVINAKGAIQFVDMLERRVCGKMRVRIGEPIVKLHLVDHVSPNDARVRSYYSYLLITTHDNITHRVLLESGVIGKKHGNISVLTAPAFSPEFEPVQLTSGGDTYNNVSGRTTFPPLTRAAVTAASSVLDTGTKKMFNDTSLFTVVTASGSGTGTGNTSANTNLNKVTSNRGPSGCRIELYNADPAVPPAFPVFTFAAPSSTASTKLSTRSSQSQSQSKSSTSSQVKQVFMLSPHWFVCTVTETTATASTSTTTAASNTRDRIYVVSRELAAVAHHVPMDTDGAATTGRNRNQTQQEQQKHPAQRKSSARRSLSTLQVVTDPSVLGSHLLGDREQVIGAFPLFHRHGFVCVTTFGLLECELQLEPEALFQRALSEGNDELANRIGRTWRLHVIELYGQAARQAEQKNLYTRALDLYEHSGLTGVRMAAYMVKFGLIAEAELCVKKQLAPALARSLSPSLRRLTQLAYLYLQSLSYITKQTTTAARNVTMNQENTIVTNSADSNNGKDPDDDADNGDERMQQLHEISEQCVSAYAQLTGPRSRYWCSILERVVNSRLPASVAFAGVRGALSVENEQRLILNANRSIHCLTQCSTALFGGPAALYQLVATFPVPQLHAAACVSDAFLRAMPVHLQLDIVCCTALYCRPTFMRRLAHCYELISALTLALAPCPSSSSSASSFATVPTVDSTNLLCRLATALFTVLQSITDDDGGGDDQSQKNPESSADNEFKEKVNQFIQSENVYISICSDATREKVRAVCIEELFELHIICLLHANQLNDKQLSEKLRSSIGKFRVTKMIQICVDFGHWNSASMLYEQCCNDGLRAFECSIVNVLLQANDQESKERQLFQLLLSRISGDRMVGLPSLSTADAVNFIDHLVTVFQTESLDLGQLEAAMADRLSVFVDPLLAILKRALETGQPSGFSTDFEMALLQFDQSAAAATPISTTGDVSLSMAADPSDQRSLTIAAVNQLLSHFQRELEAGKDVNYVDIVAGKLAPVSDTDAAGEDGSTVVFSCHHWFSEHKFTRTVLPSVLRALSTEENDSSLQSLFSQAIISLYSTEQRLTLPCPNCLLKQLPPDRLQSEIKKIV